MRGEIAAGQGPDGIGARIDRLAASPAIWTRVVLLSLGGCFEYYDLFLTGYIAPGLVRSGILTPTTPGLFGTSGIASFVAALFAGLFVGTALCSASSRTGSAARRYSPFR